MKYNNIEFKEIPGYPTYYALNVVRYIQKNKANRRKVMLPSQSVNNVDM